MLVGFITYTLLGLGPASPYYESTHVLSQRTHHPGRGRQGKGKMPGFWG